ncbi:hypothetical protein [Hippea maritima]|uniref:O-antigen polymerase n=1 Tax=Hippea maritima (strain ATCC 700847 / DSM 10411 / MH2) TaxID=760142 RepID=F2LUP7_HIPMA|nr:hypothetical protein [Hippea maritima]AEA34637.1 hypothetical protein Hipma_1695 [Hippea maritima DSM 10411]
MNEILKKSNSLNVILLFGLLLVPFMSLPVMPSDYRPISIFFLVPFSFLITLKYLIRLKISKDIFYLLLFLVFVSIQSVLLLDNIFLSLRYIAPVFLGIFSYIAIRYFFIKNNIEKVFDKFFVLYILIAVIGFVEILSMKGLLPHSLKDIIGIVFSGKVSSRIQLISSEGSWASKIIIFSIPIYLYYYCKNGYFNKSFYVLLLLFVMIFSLEGFAIVATAFMLYLSYDFFHIFKKLITFRYKLKYYFILVISIVILSILINIILSTNTGYAINRIYKFLDATSLWELLSLDGSTFIRVIYPYIGFEIFVDHPFGVGLGGYAQYFNHYINLIPVDYSKFNEVVGDIATVSADPKSLYAKIFSETGIIGIGLLFLFFKQQIKYLKYNIKINPKFKLYFIYNLAFAFASVIQFGSFAYLPFWFAFALNSAFYTKGNNEKNFINNQ